MPEFTLKARIQNKYKSLAEWNLLQKGEFIPLKGEICYAVEDNVLYQKLGDGETDFVDLPWLSSQGSSSSSPDFAENDETSASYIKNRTHYDLGSVYIPELAPDGSYAYWDGTSLEVTADEESELADTINFTLPEGMSWLTRADVSGGEGGCISRMSRYTFTEDEVKKMNLASFIVYGPDDTFNNFVYGPAHESPLFADGEVNVGFINLSEILPVDVTVGYGFFVDNSIPFVVVLNQPMNWAYFGVSDHADKFAPPGTYGIDFSGTLTLAQVISTNVKQLEGKYLPNWPDISVNEYSSYSRITVTDKNNLTKTVTVRNGQDGVPGKNGTNGKDGATFTPYIDANGYLSWTNTVGATNPTPVKVQYKEEWPTDEHIMELIERVMVTKEW